MKKLSENGQDIIKHGVIMGCVMFIVTTVYLGIQKDKEFALLVLPYLGLFLIGYMLTGMLFFFVYYRKEREQKDGFLKYCMKGISGIYWINNAFILILALGALLAKQTPIRIILLLDAAVMVGFLVLDYVYISKCADELNHTFKPQRVMLVDLDECPGSAEAFCIEIERYCIKNGRSLKFVKREKPAEIYMDNEHYMVELDSFYQRFGPMYALKFIQIKDR